MPHYTLAQIAHHVGGAVQGSPDAAITGVANPDSAGPEDLVFVLEEKHHQAFLERVALSQAGGVIAAHPIPEHNTIIVENPRVAMARALELFAPPAPPAGVHPSAVVADSVVLGEEVSVGAGCVIGERTVIGAGTRLHPGVIVAEDVQIGRGAVLHARVVVREGCRLGDRVIVQPGAVVGSDGYGFVQMPEKTHLKIPQIGTVIVGDDVEIGANVTIDRATIGETVIGRGTKIDNLVHIAHNVHIGENVLLVSQVGISGSVSIGDRSTLAGQVGVAGHLSIGADSLVLARTGVTKDVPDRSVVSGFPSRPHRDELRRLAALDKVPELLKQVRELAQHIEQARPEEVRV